MILESSLMMIPLTLMHRNKGNNHLPLRLASINPKCQMVSIHCKRFKLTNAAPVGAIFAPIGISNIKFELTH